MASSREYLDYVLEQLSGLEGITYRAMMGEYLIYYRGKLVGGVYDDRFLVKITKSSKDILPNSEYQRPYEGAKEMLLVDELENRGLLKSLILAMYGELPEPGRKK